MNKRAEIHYEVDGRTTYATIDKVWTEMFDMLDSLDRKRRDREPHIHPKYYKLLHEAKIPETVTASATCDERDEFIEEKGKEIARDKLLKKMAKIKKKYLTTYLAELEGELEVINMAIERQNNRIAEIEQRNH